MKNPHVTLFASLICIAAIGMEIKAGLLHIDFPPKKEVLSNVASFLTLVAVFIGAKHIVHYAREALHSLKAAITRYRVVQTKAVPRAVAPQHPARIVAPVKAVAHTSVPPVRPEPRSTNPYLARSIPSSMLRYVA